MLYDPGSIALCRILTKHWGALSPLFSSLGGTMPTQVPESPRVDQLVSQSTYPNPSPSPNPNPNPSPNPHPDPNQVTPGGRYAKQSSEGRPSSALRVSGTSRRSLG